MVCSWEETVERLSLDCSGNENLLDEEMEGFFLLWVGRVTTVVGERQCFTEEEIDFEGLKSFQSQQW